MGPKLCAQQSKPVFGGRAEVQRCQLHERRNVAEYLPKNAQGDYDHRIRNAYALTNYAEAKTELQKISTPQTESLVDSTGPGRVRCSPPRVATFTCPRDNFAKREL
jgi:Transposase, Mutator family